MKRIGFTFYFLFMLLVSQSLIAGAVTLKVTIGKDINTVDQTVYLFKLKGNEYNLVDSCFITKGQTVFSLQGQLENDWNLCWLTFSQKGPIQFFIHLAADDNAEIYFSEDERKPTIIKGSDIAMQYYSSYYKKREARQKLNLFTDSMFIVNNKQEQNRIKDSVNYYKNYIDFEPSLDILKNTNLPSLYYSELRSVENNISQQTLDSIIYKMKNKFPDYNLIQIYPDYEISPPQSINSKRVRKKFNNIIEKRTNEPHQAYDEVTPVDISSIIPLKEGDNIGKLSLPGVDKKDRSIENISTNYILIDFWAAWCAPCRKEIPNLKLALASYKDWLTVYAVSFDNTTEEWIRAIAKDKSEIFTHVYGGNLTTSEGKKLAARFGIKAIPANFLLDKDRKIIAVNLRGEELEKKMEELLSK